MKLLDLFCGAGGGAYGYHIAGFDSILGIDNQSGLNYPFTYLVGDVFEICSTLDLSSFDLIHASPPCQSYSTLAQMNKHITAPKLIDPIRELLQKSGVPYVIENVENAPLNDPLLLCGSMFGLKVRRHRLFETSFSVPQPLCNHKLFDGNYPRNGKRDGGKLSKTVPVYGRAQLAIPIKEEFELRKEAMGIDWMTWNELNEAIPPAYTKYIGEIFLNE